MRHLNRIVKYRKESFRRLLSGRSAVQICPGSPKIKTRWLFNGYLVFVIMLVEFKCKAGVLLMTGVEELAQVLRESRNTVFFGGAGMSTESGVPDFRCAKGI